MCLVMPLLGLLAPAYTQVIYLKLGLKVLHLLYQDTQTEADLTAYSNQYKAISETRMSEGPLSGEMFGM